MLRISYICDETDNAESFAFALFNGQTLSPECGSVVIENDALSLESATAKDKQIADLQAQLAALTPA